MSDEAGLKVVVSADVQGLQTAASKGVQTIKQMEDELVALDRAIDRALTQGKNTAPLEKAFDTLVAKIKAAKAEAIALGNLPPIKPPPIPPIPPPNDKPLLGSLANQRIAFIDLGRAITGQGFSLRALASNFALLGPGVAIGAAALYGLFEVLSKQTDAEKKAAEEAKRLHDVLLNLKDAGDITLTATGSEEGNIDRVRALAAAIADSNKPYKERQNALNELRETNKAYFGDLTLEAKSLATLSDRVREYSQALITEAIVKGQVDEIAKVSSEFEKQVQVLNKLRDARTRAQDAVNKQGSIPVSAGNVAGGGPDVLSNKALSDLSAANNAFNKQQEAVDKLSTSLGTYKGALNQAIDTQIQQKPLQVPPKYGDDLKSIIPILEKIKSIYDDLNKADTRPIFKRFADANDKNAANLISAQIQEAIKKGATDGANDPAIRSAYDDLVKALNAKLLKLRNPDLRSSIVYTLANPADVEKAFDKVESQVEKTFGKDLSLKVPIGLKSDLEAFDPETFGINLKKAIDEAEKRLGNVAIFTLPIKIQIEKAAVQEQLDKQLGQALDPKALEKKLANSGLEGIGQAIGDAIAKGTSPIEAAGKSLFTALGQLIEDIGKNLIEYGIAKSFLDTVLKSGIALPGLAAIGLGIAAEAIGALVKSTGASYHAFATGGIVTGPTLGLVGEAGPEVIFPLSQLNRFVQSTQGRGAQTISVTGRIAGNDLRLALARTNKQQGLV